MLSGQAADLKKRIRGHHYQDFSPEDWIAVRSMFFDAFAEEVEVLNPASGQMEKRKFIDHYRWGIQDTLNVLKKNKLI